MKINFYLKNPSGDYETWIYCLISYQNKRVKIYTDQKINPKFWNLEAQRVRQTLKFKNHSEYNSWLLDIISAADKIELDWKKLNSDKAEIPPIPSHVLKEKLRKYLTKITKDERKEKEKFTFWGYYENFLHRMENGTRVHLEKGTPLASKTIFQFHNLKRHLINFEQREKFKIDFENIDLNFYKKFVDYLTIKLQVGPNTIGKLITNLKVFLREALEDGITANNVFTHRKFKSLNFKSDTVYLTTAEIKEMQNLDLAGQPRYDRVRDTFVIGCYTGLRFSDLIKIQPHHIENGMIEITQTKTQNAVVIPMVKDVVQILEKYKNSLPKISNQKYNEYLYEVCKKCEALKLEITTHAIKGGKRTTIIMPKYEFISSHTARRSFATNEYKAGDLEVSEIMAITGHKTEKAFYKYIRETPKETAMRIKQKFVDRELRQAAITNHLKAV
ncbi:MAG: phage integrase SAM-like domain-containing protein [Ginsengibacter sp.]